MNSPKNFFITMLVLLLAVGVSAVIMRYGPDLLPTTSSEVSSEETPSEDPGIKNLQLTQILSVSEEEFFEDSVYENVSGGSHTWFYTFDDEVSRIAIALVAADSELSLLNVRESYGPASTIGVRIEDSLIEEMEIAFNYMAVFINNDFLCSGVLNDSPTGYNESNSGIIFSAEFKDNLSDDPAENIIRIFVG